MDNPAVETRQESESVGEETIIFAVLTRLSRSIEAIEQRQHWMLDKLDLILTQQAAQARPPVQSRFRKYHNTYMEDDVPARIFGDFITDAIRQTGAEKHRITRLSLFAAYTLYYYQWLRREVTYYGMTEDQAGAAYERRWTQTRLSRNMNEEIDSGRLPLVRDIHLGTQRAWKGLCFQDWVEQMVGEGQEYELTLRPGVPVATVYGDSASDEQGSGGRDEQGDGPC